MYFLVVDSSRGKSKSRPKGLIPEEFMPDPVSMPDSESEPESESETVKVEEAT